MNPLNDIYLSIFDKFEATEDTSLAAKHNLRVFFDSIYVPFLKTQELIKLGSVNINLAENRSSIGHSYNAAAISQDGIEQEEDIHSTCRDEVIDNCNKSIKILVQKKKELEEFLLNSYEEYIGTNNVMNEFYELVEEQVKKKLLDDINLIEKKRENQLKTWQNQMRMADELVKNY